MECNKDEATRAKEIAERKFTARDLMGAKKFALKAQNLFPGLEGIPQMLATLDVHISAENKVSGEADWYGILGVDPRADDDAVRKQYRKLALMLHPDKNKSVGADGAFKLLSEAWSLLSDKAKRVAYDQKRNGKVNHRVASSSGGSQAPPPPNGFYNFTKPTTTGTKTQKGTARAGRSSAPASSQKSKPSTFWTVCRKCKMQYEYLRIYLNHHLLCPNCHEPFLAVEIEPPPTHNTKSATPWNSSQQQQQTNRNAFHGGRGNVFAPDVGAAGFNDSFQWGPFSKGSGASTAAQAASVVQQAYEKAKREREEAQAAMKREEAFRRKNQASKKVSSAASTGNPNTSKRRRGIDDVGVSSIGKDVRNQMGMGAGQANFEHGRVNGSTRPSITTDISLVEIQKIQKEMIRKEILEKLKEYAVAKTAPKEVANGSKGEAYVGNLNVNESGEPVDAKNGSNDKKPSGISGAHPDARALDTMSINVPDPDFHDFDKDRSEKCFGDNQVWAAYDGDDGMPRYYALIQNVVSLDPFAMRISWLNSKTNSELGPLNWVSSGFTKTCGDFRVGKYETNRSLNSFSHRVRWTKGPRGAICIYPRKGDVWALYRNWSPEWNELTEDEVIHKYDMVEIVEDYSEDQGVLVTPLVKVAGFKTVFHRHLDPRETRRIPREEMFRFSHHVPSYLLTGQEAPNAPKGCRELDPAATPLELLQVIADVKEEDLMDNDERFEEVKVVGDAEKANDIETAVNSSSAREEEKGSLEGQIG